VVEAEVELRVLDPSEVPALLVHGILASNRHRGARPPQDVDEADLVDPQVVEPELPLLALPTAGVDPHHLVVGAVEAEGHAPPVHRPMHPGVVAGDGAVGAVDLDAERPLRLEALGLDPAAHAVAAVGRDLHLLHHPAVAVGLAPEALEAQRGLSLLERLGVDEAHLARLVMEAEAREAIALVLLEPAIGDLHRGVGDEPRLAALHDEERIPHGQACRKVAVVGQHAPAVAGREDDRHDLDALLLADGLHGLEPAEVLGWLKVQPVEAGGQDHAVEAMLGRGPHDPADVLDVLLAPQPARHIHPPQRVHLAARQRTRRRQAHHQQGQRGSCHGLPSSRCVRPGILRRPFARINRAAWQGRRGR